MKIEKIEYGHSSQKRFAFFLSADKVIYQANDLGLFKDVGIKLYDTVKTHLQSKYMIYQTKNVDIEDVPKNILKKLFDSVFNR